MKQSRQLLILALCATILLILYIVSLFAGRKSEVKTVSSALLNERYVGDVDVVRVTIPSTDDFGTIQIEVQKTGSVWLFSPEPGLTAPVSISRMDELFDAAKRVRKMSIFADTAKNREAFALNPESAVHMEFAAKTGEVFSSVYFGAEDFTGRNIAVRAEKSTAIYQTANDFAPWLTTDRKLWTDMQLIPQAALFKTADDIQTVQYRPLLAYRGSGLLTVTEAVPKDSVALQMWQGERVIIRIEGGNGTIVMLSVFPISENSAAVVPKIEAGPAVSPESRQALESLSYTLEVSRWTYDAIMKLVNQNGDGL
jgi:hypothetical protein